MSRVSIPEVTTDPAIDMSLDTIKIGKQALVFCNTRRSSEATAEKIAKEIKTNSEELDELNNQILKVLSTPTKQCRRLAMCVRRGTAFHHAGLAAGQRKIVENGFKIGLIKIICSTPTLAMGINLPAFRTIIKDLKRYGGRWGLQYIPTLEYHQMAGRAGRPDFNDKFGQAICIAKTESDAEEILERFIYADPENIYSKLAVEPVLRTYCLSLIATGFANSYESLINFFEKTFYGYQYGDMAKLGGIIQKILELLEEWEFIRYKEQKEAKQQDNRMGDFVSATNYNTVDTKKIEVTKIGARVAQLYLDPYTAFFIITSLRRATQKVTNEFSYLQMALSTIELRPLSTVRVKEVEYVESEINERESFLITYMPSVFESEYDDFLKSIKTTIALESWMDESTEDNLLDLFNITPGELHYKKNLVDWILYSANEMATLLSFNDLIKMIRKTRFRLDKGIKEELIPLARLKKIGRARARKLFNNGIKDLGDIKKADITKLKQLLGEKLALDVKKQVGEEVEVVKKGKRKGQLGLGKY